MRDPSRVRVAGPLAPFADGFRLELTRQGYAPSSASQRLQLMACMSSWMAVQGVSTGALSAERVERFVQFRRRAGYRGQGRPLGLAVLLAYLRGLGVVAAATEPEPSLAPVDLLIDRYRRYLLDERGLAAGTVRFYVRFARGFLLRVAAPDGHLDLAHLAAGEVSRLLLQESAVRSVGSARNLVVAWRSLLRYLHVRGITDGDLTAAVLAVAPRARSLPRALEPGVVDRLLASCDRRTPKGPARLRGADRARAARSARRRGRRDRAW